MTKLIIGLGNPEPEYLGTRHNVGRFVVQKWAENCAMPDFVLDKDLGALVSSGSMGEEWVVCVLPDNYMNTSGTAVKKAISKYDVTVKDIVIVHDDLDLPFGTLRVAQDRGIAGHNGLRSVVEQIGSKDFGRIRVGISPASPTGEIYKPEGDKAVQRFVLSHIPKGGLECLSKVTESSIVALDLIMKGDYTHAMGQCNGAHCTST